MNNLTVPRKPPAQVGGQTKPSKINSQLDYILVDSSGSMSGDLWFHSLQAIDAYVAGVKDANIKSHIILQTFDSKLFDNVLFDVPIEQWDGLHNYDMTSCVGWASTPLYDAINTMGRRLRDLDPPRCSIVIVTDGEENASRYTDLTQAKAILDWCRAKGWQVTFIGANFSNRQQASLLGSNPASAIGVEQRHLVDATKSLAAKRKRYGLYGEDMHYTEDERQQFGGYLESK